MRAWTAIVVSAVLAACASLPTALPPPPVSLLEDSLFTPPKEPIRAADVFALSDDMRHFLHQEIGSQLRSLGPSRGLVEALNRKSQIHLEYDTEMTRTASQAFSARAGNCLSLVVMTAAMAKELGLNVTYQSVFTDETWSRNRDLYFTAGHVNLVLGRRLQNVTRTLFGDPDTITIDFLPPKDAADLRSVPISEQTVTAMFMNNRSAEDLAQGKVDDAYWWAREAIRQDPNFLPAYNTLGVVYMRHGDKRQAEFVFHTVLGRDPSNTVTMSNEVKVLGDLGRTNEAQILNATLTRLQPNPPFYFFNQGMAAMNRGDYQAAKDLFAKEVDRAPYYHEFHFWLGLAYYRLGNLTEARKELNEALDNAVTIKQHSLYAAKLESLKAYMH